MSPWLLAPVAISVSFCLGTVDAWRLSKASSEQRTAVGVLVVLLVCIWLSYAAGCSAGQSFHGRTAEADDTRTVTSGNARRGFPCPCAGLCAQSYPPAGVRIHDGAGLQLSARSSDTACDSAQAAGRRFLSSPVWTNPAAPAPGLPARCFASTPPAMAVSAGDTGGHRA